MKSIPTHYLSRDGIEAINAARRKLEARIQQKREERRHETEFGAALDGFKRCGWPDQAAQEMAHFQVYGEWK
jgi:hypothetical protein